MYLSERNIKYTIVLVLSIILQCLLVVIYGFTEADLPTILYAVSWLICIVLVKWAASNLSE